MNTPFFPAFRPRLAACKTAAARLRARPAHHLEALLGRYFPEALLAASARGLNSRCRLYPLRLTFWAFLWQVLNPQSPCREVVRQVQSWLQLPTRADTAAYCQARCRLPRQTLEELLEATAQKVQTRAGSQELWLGRRVKIVDGSSVSLPDTPAHQRLYPQSSQQKPGGGFPVLKFVGLFCLASGALLDFAAGSLALHDIQLFRRLWSSLPRGDVLLADRGFSAYVNVALLLQRGVDAVLRLHQGKKIRLPKRSALQPGKRLGHGDGLRHWKKPKEKPLYMSKKQWRSVPQEITVRVLQVAVRAKGMRTRHVVLVTTLLDPIQYPAQELAWLYYRRWQVELSFRDLKTTLGMEILRCKSPAMAHKELLMHFIAFNLIRCLMLEAASGIGTSPYRLSFKGTLDTLRQFAPRIAAARAGKARRQLIEKLLEVLASDPVPCRPGRREPRALKRRPKPYQLLTRPRHLMVELPHRGKYRKPKMS